ncbi:hypothetical protein JWJ88_17140 [Paracoccus methylovorus]|uniref:Ead/Ea22-like family protein n=1 Tax=Paracoccus methylovorus TaxID=2812658 RepID=A0ABX7JLL7_9RHOB|nr:hypothetical protein [Paracoccus methylovorus]QRZ14689.1 hypothetical protein JWJ88_17140 [Paracoccus methylovorus]
MSDPNIAHAAWQVGQSATVLAQEIAGYHATWFSVLKPKLTKDGNMWCALHGADLQEGIAGFGPTPAKALLAFEAAMCSESGSHVIERHPMTEDAKLIERLRERAEDERKIQRNNQAVADALATQMDAFARQDGTHNNFAVRLGYQHKSCAENDAQLAADWDDAAARLTALIAENERLREALRRIEQISASQDNGTLYENDTIGWHMALDDAVDVARAALSGDEGGV